MRICLLAFLAGFVVAVAFTGCARNPVAGLEVPEQLTLYSVDGLKLQQPKTDGTFHGFPVLGKVEITDAAKRREIATALKNGLTQSDGEVFDCFWPRHAIRTVEKGRVIDYVICFQCLQLEAHDGDSISVKPVTRKPQSVLNKHLQEAGIALAPGMVDGDR